MSRRISRSGALRIYAPDNRSGLDVYSPILWDKKPHAPKQRDDPDCRLPIGEGRAAQVDVAASKQEEDLSPTNILIRYLGLATTQNASNADP